MNKIVTTSLKENFIYRGLLTIANPLLGMVTFPYVSRVLGVENMGLVNFVDNTITYFLLFATLGVGSLGVRVTATAKNTRHELDKTFSNVLGMNLLFTLGVLIFYNISICLIPRFNEYAGLFYIGNAKILFTALLIEWFFNGIENFKYITIRSLLIRLAYVISIFVFVRQSDDYKLYFILTVLMTIVNAVINILYSRRYVRIIPKQLISGRFLKENINLGIYAIMTSMYLTFNVMFLGLRTSNMEVGYYTSAFKLYHLILSIFSAFSSVMLPRMSALVSEHNDDRFKYLINKSFDFIWMFSIPLILCCIVMAPEIIYIICGEGYEGAILPMRIIMPALLPVGMAHVMAMQVLIPLKKDHILLRASIVGAIVSIIINIMLVTRLQSVGSAIVLVTSETTLSLIYIAYIKYRKIIKVKFSPMLKYIITAIPSVAVCLIFKLCITNPVTSLALSVVTSALLYVLGNYRPIRRLLNI